MKEKTRYNVITILLLVLALTAFFLLTIGSANSWFTDSSSKGVKISVNVSGLSFNLYQNSISTSNLINTDDFNEEEGETKYIDLNTEISPDEDVDLILILQNTDKGKVYVRFKFEVVVDGIEDDTIINPTLTSDFIKVGDYYYYGTGTSNAFVSDYLEGNESATLFTKFKIAYDDFDGVFSETVKLNLTIEAQSSAFI